MCCLDPNIESIVGINCIHHLGAYDLPIELLEDEAITSHNICHEGSPSS